MIKDYLLDERFDIVDVILCGAVGVSAFDNGFVSLEFIFTAIVIFILGFIKEILK